VIGESDYQQQLHYSHADFVPQFMDIYNIVLFIYHWIFVRITLMKVWILSIWQANKNPQRAQTSAKANTVGIWSLYREP